jgi:hypothetical protein
MYVELHARSAFSFLEGASVPEELVALGAGLGIPAIALLDRDGVYGAPRFHMASKKANIRAHIGAEVTGPEGIRYPLLVSTRAGYRNLCRLITCMKLRAKKGEGSVTEEELAEHAEGLICLTGGEEGPLAAALTGASPGWGLAAGNSGCGTRDRGLESQGFAVAPVEACPVRDRRISPRSASPESRVPSPEPRPSPESRIEWLCEIFGRSNV